MSSNNYKAVTEDGGTLFTRMHVGRTSNRNKLLRGKFGLDIRGRKTFSGRTIKHWNRLLGEMVESPSLEIFKTQLDRGLDNLNWGPAFNRRLDLMVSSISFQPKVCCDSNILS